MNTGAQVAIFVVVAVVALMGLAVVIEKIRAVAQRVSENGAALFWSGLGLVTATVIAMQIGCTWWLDQRRAADLSSIHYNTEYVKLAADQWESGQSAVKCK